jgi:hypothetical protein
MKTTSPILLSLLRLLLLPAVVQAQDDYSTNADGTKSVTTLIHFVRGLY